MITRTTRSSLPPEDQWVPRLFRREDCFYVIDLPEDADLQEHVDLNPGTVRIEDLKGNQLWPDPLKEVSTTQEK